MAPFKSGPGAAGDAGMMTEKTRFGAQGCLMARPSGGSGRDHLWKSNAAWDNHQGVLTALQSEDAGVGLKP